MAASRNLRTCRLNAAHELSRAAIEPLRVHTDGTKIWQDKEDRAIFYGEPDITALLPVPLIAAKAQQRFGCLLIRLMRQQPVPCWETAIQL